MVVAVAMNECVACRAPGTGRGKGQRASALSSRRRHVAGHVARPSRQAQGCVSRVAAAALSGSSSSRSARRSQLGQQQRKAAEGRGGVAAKAASSPSAGSGSSDSDAKGGTLTTAFFIALWYAVNVCFNLTNKSLYKVFPFPWTVSTVHVVVGSIYCLVCYGLGFKRASFGRPITGEELKKISGPASMHAFGHIAANLSFAAVAISLTHTVKTLEPAFSAVLQWSILGTPTPLPVLASLVPIIFGVGMVCASELSFNWMGFLSAMCSNLTFGFRAVLSKKTMGDLKDLGSTALYAYTTVISVVLCAPLAIIMEGKALPAGIKQAVATLGWAKFSAYLFAVGIFYHLYVTLTHYS